MSGFVVIRRGAFDHHLIGDPSRFYAWCWLISTACWKPTKFNIQGVTVTLERGQLCASVRQMAEAWGWSKSAVDRFLTRLETETMIERKAGQGRTILTICNYSKYQDVPNTKRDSIGTASGTPAGHQRDTKEQGNHITSNSNELQPDDVSNEVWGDFVRHRKRKKADITKTAMAGIASQAKRANWPIEDALAEIVTRGWTGFRADWVDVREVPKSEQKPAYTPQEWLSYCEEQVRKWRKIGQRDQVEYWERAERVARNRLPKLRVVE